MASLMQTLDAVRLHGTVELQQLARQLNASSALMKAMLEKLEQMGKIERVEVCLTGCCSKCAEQDRCLTTLYRAV